MKRDLVRYVPMIGSPAWMPRRDAEALLRREDRLYVELSHAGVSALRAPRIESPLPRPMNRRTK